MTDETNGKELVLTEQVSTTQKESSKPSLILVGRRYLCTDGRFHPNLCADYVRANARNKWLTVAELAKVFTGAATIDGKRRVRKQLFLVFSRLLGMGEFLVYEADQSSGRTTAVKLLDVTSEHERQLVQPQLERMKARRQMSAEKYERAMQVVALQDRKSVV